MIAAAQLFVSSVLGEDFMPAAEKELDLAASVETELRANVPALLCSVPGFDASGRVDDLATELGKPIASIAIGSSEGFNQADRAINLAVKSGRWVDNVCNQLVPVFSPSGTKHQEEAFLFSSLFYSSFLFSYPFSLILYIPFHLLCSHLGRAYKENAANVA